MTMPMILVTRKMMMMMMMMMIMTMMLAGGTHGASASETEELGYRRDYPCRLLVETAAVWSSQPELTHVKVDLSEPEPPYQALQLGDAPQQRAARILN